MHIWLKGVKRLERYTRPLQDLINRLTELIEAHKQFIYCTSDTDYDYKDISLYECS